jgi:ribosome-binding factor A
MSDRNRGRVEETIRQLVAEVLLRKVKDPRLSNISVIRVELSKDYSVAKIFYNLIGGQKHSDISEAEKGLESGKGFIRGKIRKHLRLRIIPELVFIYDTSLDRAMHIEELIDRIHEDREE